MGYMGKYLDINLSSKKINVKQLDMALAKKYIGGKGLGAKILYEELKKGIDPLGPDNIILFMTGPLSGTPVVTSGRWCIVTKSPHTGIFLDSQIGGKFGHSLKKAGYDFIIVRGKSKTPCYINIKDDDVSILSAEELWGKGTFETEEFLKNKHEKSEVASIGPAGENLVTFAGVMTNVSHMAGRGGAGAVMGSKKLKAVVVAGTSSIDPVNDSFKELTKTFRDKVRENPGVQT